MGIFDESYSSIDLARILGVHRVTVTNWIKKGALRAGRTPGGRYKVTKKDLISFLKDQGITLPPFLQIVGKKLVVAVDDNQAILDLLKDFFSTGDMPYLYQLETFSNPVDAALFIGSSKPDLVLMDLLMPELDGFNLAKKIKEASPCSRIIVITGYATRENVARLKDDNKDYGIDAVLTKPLALKALKKFIDEIMT